MSATKMYIVYKGEKTVIGVFDTLPKAYRCLLENYRTVGNDTHTYDPETKTWTYIRALANRPLEGPRCHIEEVPLNVSLPYRRYRIIYHYILRPSIPNHIPVEASYVWYLPDGAPYLCEWHRESYWRDETMYDDGETITYYRTPDRRPEDLIAKRIKTFELDGTDEEMDPIRRWDWQQFANHHPHSILRNPTV